MTEPHRRPGSQSLPSLVAILAIALLALLPDLGPQVVDANAAVEAFHGRILSIGAPNVDEPFRPPFARVEILEGPRAGEQLEAYLEGPGGSQVVANYRPGDEVVVTVTRDAAGGPYVAVSDRWRLPLLGLVGLLFAAAVVLVGGLRGARALISLGLTIAVILKVLVPLVVGGVAPVPLAVITATLVTMATIVLTEGWSRTSGAAILGTAAALALTGLLSIAGTAIAAFTYAAGSDLAFLQTADGTGLDLRGLLLAAFILGAVGVLDDVTVTQAALVDRLAARGGQGRELFASAMDVGRSHIAATVNTLFLAYAGAGLPLLVTLVVSQQPGVLVFNSEAVATEIVRTFVGSLGIIAAVPITTLFAVVAVTPPPRLADPPRRRLDARALLIAGSSGVIVLALLVTALVPLGAPRDALPVEVFDPSQVPGAPSGDIPGPGDASEAPATPEPGPETPGPDPEMLLPGEDFTLTASGTTVEVGVTAVEPAPGGGATRYRVGVDYRNSGLGPFEVDPAAWSLLAIDGTEVILEPAATDGLDPGPIAAGERASGWLEGTIAADPSEAFVAFTSPDGTLLFVVPLD